MKILDSVHLDMGVIKVKEILKDVTETYCHTTEDSTV